MIFFSQVGESYFFSNRQTRGLTHINVPQRWTIDLKKVNVVNSKSEKLKIKWSPSKKKEQYVGHENIGEDENENELMDECTKNYRPTHTLKKSKVWPRPFQISKWYARDGMGHVV